MQDSKSMAVRALEVDGDTIYRQDAIDAVVSAMIDGADAELVEGIMELLPSAQPKCRTGHWIRHITTGLGPKLNDTIECSECRIAFSTENMFRRSFCPNCGADMRGECE